MATLTPLTCTNCGAALPSAPSGQPITCIYCGTSFQPTAPSAPLRQLGGPRCPVCSQNDQTELVARAALRFKAQRDPLAPLLAQLDQPENPQKRGLGGLLRNVTGGAVHKQQVADYEAALALWQQRDAAYRRVHWCNRDQVLFFPGHPAQPPTDLLTLLDNPPGPIKAI